MEKNGCDTELLIFAMTLINKVNKFFFFIHKQTCQIKKKTLFDEFNFVFLHQTLAALPDQDSFYDVTDCLEQLGMETIIHKHMLDKGTEPDLRAQFSIYEVRAGTTAVPEPF